MVIYFVLRVLPKQPGVTATETNMYLAEAAEQIDTPYFDWDVAEWTCQCW